MFEKQRAHVWKNHRILRVLCRGADSDLCWPFRRQAAKCTQFRPIYPMKVMPHKCNADTRVSAGAVLELAYGEVTHGLVFAAGAFSESFFKVFVLAYTLKVNVSKCEAVGG